MTAPATASAMTTPAQPTDTAPDFSVSVAGRS